MLSPFGKFEFGGCRFVINTPDLPRNWYNYFFTNHYITFTSQCGVGQGFLQDSLGRRLMSVTKRGMYAMADGYGWNLCGLPVYEERDAYSCIHEPGSTSIKLKKHEIESEYTLFVPAEDDPFTGLEASIVSIKNLSDRTREIKLISYTENDFDGTYKYQAYNTKAAQKDELLNGLHYDFSEVFDEKERAFSFFCACDRALSGWDLSKNAFIGPYNDQFDPIAIHKGGCTNSNCVAEKIGFAIQTTLSIRPGEKVSACFVCGITNGMDKVKAMCGRFDSVNKAEAELQRVKAQIASDTDGLKIKTPNANLDCLFNHWLKYQTNLGSRWARVRHNGYRDIASDTECLAAFNPSLAWERIKRLLAYQYSNGYAPRTFIDGEIKDNDFSDCAVWLSFTVYYIIMELGDISLLNEEVPFNDGSVASVYEHIKRSVEFLHGFTGHHGLIRIWGGDWNDCMNNVGIKGRGVSVWLSIAWVRAARMLKELSEAIGDKSYAETLGIWANEMCKRINKYGWDEDGGYYIYAISDDGERIGASECEEGKVFLNPQLWAVLAGGLGMEREETALKNAYALLYDELGTKVSAPPYTLKNAWLGGIAQKAPGVQENGGVYLHAMCWKLAVDAMLGDSKEVENDLTRILPFENPVVNGRAEPYTICNCYMGKETGYRYGTPGQSWRTASGQWLLKATAQFVFGLKPKLEGLSIEPCIPSGWNEAYVEKKFRGNLYKITYRRTGKHEVIFDGKPLVGSILPLKSGEVTVTF